MRAKDLTESQNSQDSIDPEIPKVYFGFMERFGPHLAVLGEGLQQEPLAGFEPEGIQGPGKGVDEPEVRYTIY